MEIEAKFKLSAAQADALRARLGPAEEVVAQHDVYLATAGVPVALRVRRDGDRAWVTLKSGFEKVNGIRVREEWEPAIAPADVAAWLTIFERLGFPAGEEVHKTRECYTHQGIHVVIDEIAELGTFCEVEAVADDRESTLARLEEVIRDLGLADQERLTKSYRDLLRAAR